MAQHCIIALLEVGEGRLSAGARATLRRDILHLDIGESLSVEHTAVHRRGHIFELAILDEDAHIILRLNKNGPSGNLRLQILER